jgi:hypothetical protein
MLTLQAVLRKIDKEDIDIRQMVAMLKGNWYTTVADLRNLSEGDAEKLGIPLLLYRAMQEELPKQYGSSKIAFMIHFFI